jgi:hypothetical protein
VLSGKEPDFELLWLAYPMAHLAIGCASRAAQGPMRFLANLVERSFWRDAGRRLV